MIKKIMQTWTNYKKKKAKKDIKDNLPYIMAKHNATFFFNNKDTIAKHAQHTLIEDYTELVMSSITASNPDKALRIQLIDKAIMFGYFKTLCLNNYIYANHHHSAYVSNEMPRYVVDLYGKSPTLKRLLGLPRETTRQSLGTAIEALSSQYLYYLYGLWAIEKAYYGYKNEWIQDLIFVAMVLAEHKYRKSISLGYVISNEQYGELLNLIGELSDTTRDPRETIHNVLDNIFGK